VTRLLLAYVAAQPVVGILFGLLLRSVNRRYPAVSRNVEVNKLS